MPALQTTYPENMPVGYAGMRANEEPVVLISRNVETAAIAMGAGVMQGCLLYTSPSPRDA